MWGLLRQTRLRLHECTSESVLDDRSTSEELAVAKEFPDLIGDLPTLVDDVQAGEVGALYRAIAEYETALIDAPTSAASGSTDPHHEILFAYYEPLAEALDAAVQANGWDVLAEFVAAYGLDDQEGVPEVTHVIANAVGRSLVRARFAGGVDTVPADCLAYLGAIPEYVDEQAVAFEESYTYGWGIGHQAHAVGDRVRELASTDHKWVSIALKTAFYADQHAAADVFEAIVTDDRVSGTIQRLIYEVDATQYYFGAVADLERDFLEPHVLAYWEWEDEIDYTFDLDPGVKRRLRQLARDLGLVEDLPADWTLQDLNPGPLSDLDEELFTGKDL